MGTYWTAGQIIQQAQREIGLAVSSDPFVSQMKEDQKFVAMLGSIGTDLAMEHQWPQLIREFSVTTAASVSDYALPSDFLEMVDQSGWNRSTRFPIGGPLSPQEWQFLKASGVGVVFNVVFRNGAVQGVGGAYVDAFRIFPAPAAGTVIAFEYRSRAWAQKNFVDPAGYLVSFSGTGVASMTVSKYGSGPASSLDLEISATASVSDPNNPVYVSISHAGSLFGNTYLYRNTPGPILLGASQTGTAATLSPGAVVAGDTWSYSIYQTQNFGPTTQVDLPTASSDQVLFDHLLVVRALKLAWKKDAGFDTASAQEDYDKTLERVKGNLSSAPRLSIVSRVIRDRLIDGSNLPITGFGGAR